MYKYVILNKDIPLTTLSEERLFDITEYSLAYSGDRKWDLRAVDDDFYFKENDKLKQIIQEIPDNYATLIDSAFGYTPALAIAKEEVRVLSFDSVDSFLETYIHILEQEMRLQKERPFFLAKVLKQSEDIELIKGSYVWIIKLDSNTATWIAWDFSTYEASLDLFELGPPNP